MPDNCGLVESPSTLHPYVEAIRLADRAKGDIWSPAKKIAENKAFYACFEVVVNLIVGTDTTTGNEIELEDSGVSKIATAFVTDGFDFTNTTVTQIVFGGMVLQDITQDTDAGVLDFTAFGGIIDGTLTLRLKKLL